RCALLSRINSRSSILDPQSSILDPQSSILDSRSSILDPRSSILGPRSSILDPRSSVLNPLAEPRRACEFRPVSGNHTSRVSTVRVGVDRRYISTNLPQPDG